MCSPLMNEMPTHEDFMFLMHAIAEDSEIPSQRKVRFAPVVTLSDAGLVPFEELKEFWYSPSELGMFKRQARQLVRQGVSNNNNNSSNDDVDEDMRGLEHVTPQRQRHRHMTIQCTVSAAKRGMSPDQIGMVARKCTQWNEELAFVQACHDYACVYSPQMLAVIPQIHSAPPEFPFAFSKIKRSATSSCATEHSRRVRRRVTLQ